MKKIVILSILFVAATISSCKKYLDVQPQFIVGSNLVVTSIQGLEGVAVGGFSQMASGNLYGGGILANSEVLADFVNPDGYYLSSFSGGQEYTHQMNIYNSNATGMWGDGYAAILTANTILQYIPTFQAQNAATCNLLKGEALFIRGSMHFELCRMFAQPWGFTADNSHLGVPIRLTPGSSRTGQTTPRSTVAQVYAQSLNDLLAAEPLLPTDNGVPSGSPEWVTQYAADAMLARIYFMQGDWADANTYCSKIISSSVFKLNDSLQSVYNELGPQSGIVSTPQEAVFQIVNTSKVNPSSGNLNGDFAAPPFGSTVPDFSMNTPFADILLSAKAVGDLRYSELYRKAFGQYYCTKYTQVNQNVTVIRLAEIYLTRAECEAQQGDFTDARNDYNMTRLRAGLIADNSTTGAALISAIRSERDLELGMEGDHYFEVKRRKGSFNTPGAGVIQWNASTMIYPIPQQEMQENKAMVQNPGY